MYEPTPDEAELAAFGLTLDDVATEPMDVWPENWEAYLLFRFLSSQWRVGMSGPTGLDYNVMYRKMDRMTLDAVRYDELEAEVQIMERAALTAMYAK